MTISAEPALAPPGAGLPPAELLAARALFALRRRTGTRRSFDARFARERGRVRALLRGLGAEAGARRVLIRRLPGLEDSSRDWSAWMTLDHLRIVHGEYARVIESLARGVVPEGTASTAAVKPAAGVGPDVVAAYEASCDAILEAAATPRRAGTQVCYVHPWFGPVDAAGYHALAGDHLAIHRAQIGRIRAALGL